MYTVITTFHEPGLNQYAQRMIDTFEQYWPQSVDFIVYPENCRPRASRPNTKFVDLLSNSADLRSFITRHADNPYAHGRAGPADVFHPKKAFKWNAVRFCYKVYAIALAAEQLNNGWLIWLDADTHTHSSVPVEWLPTVCPKDVMISYLGRGEKYHSECGWVAYNLDHSNCKKFIQDFVNAYNTDEIFKLPEWHDSYVWDEIRRRYQVTNKFYNLVVDQGSDNKAGHPFINSSLGLYMDHVKGKRKDRGASEPNDIKSHKDHPYWQNILRNRNV